MKKQAGQTALSHLIHLSDLDDTTLNRLLEKASELKYRGHASGLARGKVLGMIFFNPSLRTRMSFETAACHLDAGVSVVQPGQGAWTFETRTGTVMDGDRTEHLKEAVQVISRYVDAIGVRAFASFQNQEDDLRDTLVRDIASYASVPVINMESAREHPCQALADGMTLRERFPEGLKNRKFVLSWATHPRPLPMAVPHSALEIAARLGLKVTLTCPEEMIPGRQILDKVEKQTAAHGHTMDIEPDRKKAFDKADVVYVKSWASPLIYTDPDTEKSLRTDTFSDWTFTGEWLNKTAGAGFMHCLPVRRNVVVSDDVLDGPNSWHLEQAENRLHVQKALLLQLWNSEQSKYYRKDVS